MLVADSGLSTHCFRYYAGIPLWGYRKSGIFQGERCLLHPWRS